MINISTHTLQSILFDNHSVMNTSPKLKFLDSSKIQKSKYPETKHYDIILSKEE